MKYTHILPLFSFVVSCHAAAMDLTDKDKLRMVSHFKDKLQQEYVMTENISAIEKALSKLEASAEFKHASTAHELKAVLNQELQKFDGHLAVSWTDTSTQMDAKNAREGWFSKLARSNSGFNRVEVLKGNIGYIEFWGFDRVNDTSKRKMEAAMTMVEDTDAIIFDLRKNGGGDATMIQLISSYFFEESVHLNSFQSRKGGTPVEFWSHENVNGKKLATTPLYVLTSKNTFSAAEEFAYNLKHLGRATIIGESTRGGANPVYYFDLGNGFRASIPISKAVNPITKTNWEGVGVQPNIEVAADDAFEEAYMMALKKVRSATNNPFLTKEIEGQLGAKGSSGDEQ